MKAFRQLARRFKSIEARLTKLERMFVEFRMSSKALDDQVILEVHRNTDIAQAAVTALTALSGKVSDLTTKLDEAIANSDAHDDPAVLAALNELKANNDSVSAATPSIAAAVANTDPAVPVA